MKELRIASGEQPARYRGLNLDGDFVCSECGSWMLATCRQADHIVDPRLVCLLMLDLLGTRRAASRRVRPSFSLRPVVQSQGMLDFVDREERSVWSVEVMEGMLEAAPRPGLSRWCIYCGLGEVGGVGVVGEVGVVGVVGEYLHKELAGKKFLIVLDDVWGTCSYGLWMKLQSPFLDGAAGSKIIVSTQDAEVSKMMGAGTLVHNLEPMSNDYLSSMHSRMLKEIYHQISSYSKEKIVARCSGLPLAGRTLGGLLLRKEMNEWEEILNNKLWSLSNERDILPVLRLSYHYLPSHLKRCFAYCSILPNDYEFCEQQLILLWMAEGLIQPQPEHNKQMEDLGTYYFQELLSRLEDKQNSDHVQLGCFTKARHASYISGKYDVVKRFEAFSEVKHLRTFLPLLGDYPSNYLSRKVTFDLLPKLQYLRVLSLNGYLLTELPNSIGKLKYLRYLDLSHTWIACLLESTTSLYDLQTLILEGCRYLEPLPLNLRNLVNLRHLNNSHVDSLKAMPPQLGRLTNLQSLPNFVVGKGSDQSGIREIGSLFHLQGTLRLLRLENVIDAEDAWRANLKFKERLDELVLEWSDNAQETQLGVLDRLEPHRMLKILGIKGYAGLKFSQWIGDRLFSTMVRVNLNKCENYKILPPLGQLPSLKTLSIRGMIAVESVGPEFYGESSLPFPVLEELQLANMHNWKKWLPFAQDQVFPCLKLFSIRNCTQLEGKVPENLDSLETLGIFKCEELVISISNYKQIGRLCMDGCKAVVKASGVEFELLESLQLSNISQVRFQTRELTEGLRKVANFKIGGCEELTSSLKNEDRVLQHLISLDRLVIEGNSSLLQKQGKEAKELLQLQILTCKLKYLELNKCASISKVPEGLHHLTALQELQIVGCSSLVSFPDVGLPPSLEVIRIDGAQLFPKVLKGLHISGCKELQLITSDGFAHDNINYCLERISIILCPNLKSLPEGLCHLTNLQTLEIYDCGSLVSIPSLSGEGLPSLITTATSSLRQIKIENYNKLEMLPDMRNLNCLQELNIDYGEGVRLGSEISSHGSGLKTGKHLVFILQQIKPCHPCTIIDECDKPSNTRRSSDRRSGRCIGYRLSRNLDRNLSLSRGRSRSRNRDRGLNQRQIWGWGHHRSGGRGRLRSRGRGRHRHSWGRGRGRQKRILILDRVRELWVDGEDPYMVSFPPEGDTEMDMEMLLPESLTHLSIGGFPNMKKLSSKGFQLLTSLQYLRLQNCPKLASIPLEGLALSLSQFHISGCPKIFWVTSGSQLLVFGRYCHKIFHIPHIEIYPTLPRFILIYCLQLTVLNDVEEKQLTCRKDLKFQKIRFGLEPRRRGDFQRRRQRRPEKVFNLANHIARGESHEHNLTRITVIRAALKAWRCREVHSCIVKPITLDDDLTTLEVDSDHRGLENLDRQIVDDQKVGSCPISYMVQLEFVYVTILECFGQYLISLDLELVGMAFLSFECGISYLRKIENRVDDVVLRYIFRRVLFYVQAIS
ncbi:hypothetical protein PRUPE_2G067600 [Prunus persica]|uniref:Uncharacterized protein n=1 Tax=Prunus persica TaxID=3760 RepID=A0A251QCC0_PRUPE|nr:hypothetical protein PRUPE_2G067600 [Prunus persica]